ncbi:MAG: phage baseplate assembly protein V [Rhodobacteraceae bacterium]|nr:phage baseplate assembly protein V [Paracoccaceae bacterium]
MSFAAAEADRRVANGIMLGTVTSVNAGSATARVQIGDLASPELPVAQLRAGILSFWWMPTVGEQVVVACPSGDVAQGVILASIFAGNAPSSNPATPMIDLAGGTLVVNGDIEVTGDVTASGVSLVHHTHGGVVSGSNKTGEPS